jgi:magnesium-protoporphyrin O-methyltransferase
MLLDLVRRDPLEGASILDVGGGIGVIDQELLKAGAARATLAEASPASLAAARLEAVDAGLVDRMTFIEGDVVRHAGAIEAADIVTLDRVVCCYGDAASLVTLTAGLARHLYALVLPRSRWLVRAAISVEGLWFRVTRRAYRPYAHDTAWIDQLVEAQGLEPIAESGTFFWRVVVYRRTTTEVIAA